MVLSNSCWLSRHIGGIMGNYGGIMGNYGGIMGNHGGIMGNYGGIVGNYGEIMNLGCHFLCCWSLFVVVVWPLASTDMSDLHPHNNVLNVRLAYLYKAPREYIELWWNYGESCGIMGNYGGIMGNYG